VKEEEHKMENINRRRIRMFKGRKIMKCQHCNTELNERSTDITAEFANYDGDNIDVVITCNICGSKFNGFLETKYMVFSEGGVSNLGLSEK
jgi:RNase P subunit RPR2